MRKFAVIAMVAASLSGCSWFGTGPKNHVLEAAVIGGIAGGILGGVAGGNGSSAAVGAGIGAAAGAAIAAALDR
jgi:osmotically inducible lipoprotein OsmB